MKEQLYMIIKTNSYTGNFERELMAYVFGYDNDGYADRELNIFDREMGEDVADRFCEYLDMFAYGRRDPEYSCYDIGSHPTNKEYNCDSIFIALQKEFPNDLYSLALNRLSGFCDYYQNEYKHKIEILGVDYYSNKLIKEEEVTLPEM